MRKNKLSIKLSTTLSALALTAALGGTATVLAGCSEMQQPPMTPAQADIYNKCMSTHWSSLADSALFRVAGYEYHQNQVLNCQQLALMQQSAVASNQPVAVPASMPAKANQGF